MGIYIFFITVIGLILLFSFYNKRSILFSAMQSVNYSKGKSGKKFKFENLIIVSSLILFSGFRFMTGTDFLQLQSVYSDYINYPFFEIFNNSIEDYEYSKWFIVALILKISNHVQYIFIIAAFLFVLPLIHTLNRKSVNYQYSVLLVILIGFYTQSFNIIWQMAAVSVLFYAVSFFLEKKYFKFILLSLFALGLHSSVVLVLPIFLILSFLKTSYKNIVLILTLSLIVFFNKPLMNMVFLIWPDYNLYVGYRGSNIGLYLQLGVWLCLTSIILKFKNRLIEVDKANGFYILCLTVSLGIMILGTQNVIFDRMATYFKVYILYLIPSFFELFTGKEKILIIYFSSIFFFIWFLFYLKYNGVIPYKNILFTDVF